MDVRHFHLWRQGIGINRKTVIWRCDCPFPSAQIFPRLISAAMPEFQFESSTAKGVAEHLMAETNSEDWLFANQISHGFMRVGKRCRIAGTIREKNSIR